LVAARLAWDSKRLLTRFQEKMTELRRQLYRETTDKEQKCLAEVPAGQVSKAEGLNKKSKTLKRKSCGFRDQQYFKLKILAIHKTRYELVG